MQSEDDMQALSRVIKARKTLKVLRDVEHAVEISEENASRYNRKVIESIETAGWAPFHYNRAHNGLAEPWRAHVIWHEDCRIIASQFHDWFPDVKASNKLPAMLSACGALIVVTWLPQFRGEDQQLEGVQNSIGLPKQTTIDDEHLAASAAMVQNLLLLLTASSMGTYWSSGGQFRTPAMFDRLGVSQDESFLGGVFVEYPCSVGESIERIGGKQRGNRSQNHAWLREVRLKES